MHDSWSTMVMRSKDTTCFSSETDDLLSKGAQVTSSLFCIFAQSEVLNQKYQDTYKHRSIQINQCMYVYMYNPGPLAS